MTSTTRSPSPGIRAGRALTLIASLGFLAYLLARPGVTIPAAREGLSLWAFAVLPSLLPFSMGTLLLRESGALELLTPALSFLPRLLGLPRCSAATILAGWLSGYPVGARLTAGLLAQGRISVPEAQRLLQLTSTASPVFMLGTVGVAFFGNLRAGLTLVIAHLLGAMILCRATKAWAARRDPRKPRALANRDAKKEAQRASLEAPPSAPENIPPPPFAAALAKALQESALLQLPVAASIAIAFVLLSALPGSLAAFPPVRGFVEMSTGAKAAADAGLAFLPRLCMAGFSLGFGGLAILAQTTVALSGSGLSLPRLILHKLLHAGLSAGLTALIAPLVCGGAAAASAFPAAFPVVYIGGIWLTLCGIAAAISLRAPHGG